MQHFNYAITKLANDVIIAIGRSDTMNIILNQAEARVLGSLIEKDITTPDYYPLALNALINAGNQKSNREPVMNLDEDTVRPALRNPQQKRLEGPDSSADSRVTKYVDRA